MSSASVVDTFIVLHRPYPDGTPCSSAKILGGRFQNVPKLYKDFDFRLLDNKEFGEDSVREELIVPLLGALGYSSSPPYRIVRSRKLDNPFVQFGTVRKGITIIPDYLFEKNGTLTWVLDAKGPSENIDTGKNVEQAYSYAMHRDIKVPLYALCNGRKLTVFHVQYEKPLFDVSLANLDPVWPDILTVLGSRSAWTDGRRPDFAFDLGLSLTKAGLTDEVAGKETMQMFLSVAIGYIGRVKDDLYTMSFSMVDIAVVEAKEGTEYMVSFDFDESVYKRLLDKLDPSLSQKIQSGLSSQPFHIALEPQVITPEIAIVARAGSHIYTNDNESYRPFVIEKIISGD